MTLDARCRNGVDSGGPRVGTGPILRIGKNDKAPTRYRPPHWLNTDATFIRAQFCKPCPLVIEPAGNGPKIHGATERKARFDFTISPARLRLNPR